MGGLKPFYFIKKSNLCILTYLFLFPFGLSSYFYFKKRIKPKARAINNKNK